MSLTKYEEEMRAKAQAMNAACESESLAHEAATLRRECARLAALNAELVGALKTIEEWCEVEVEKTTLSLSVAKTASIALKKEG